jgi:ABC-2 type transport system permease protein
VRIWPIYKKELRLYFTSPVAYVVLTIFVFITGLFFSSIFLYFAQASVRMANPMMTRDLNVTDNVLRPLFENMRVILLFVVPLVTMRLFAEERRSGTMELLMTYPVRDGAILLGKYLAALTLYGVMLAAMLAYPAMIARFAPVEWGALATGYVGLLLMGAMFLAIGVLASSLTENQIIAALVTFGILLSFWIVGWMAEFAGDPSSTVLRHLSIIEHNDTFSKGVLDTKDIIYFIDFTLLSLFLTLRSLESRRWAG